MILDDKTQEKPEISYPTQWGFKIIGRDKDALHKAVKDIMGGKEHLCHYGQPSSGGKFHSYNASCEVGDQEERDRLFKAFQDHNEVRMVI